jgi:hypothetical protein
MSDADQAPIPGNESQPEAVKPLGLIVEQEARRALSEAQLEPDPTLVAEGWERRFIADARQTREAIELYTQLGYEVRAEPVRLEEMGDDCEDCQILVLLQFKTIYTRKKRD